jgi:hypothetical protein
MDNNTELSFSSSDEDVNDLEEIVEIPSELPKFSFTIENMLKIEKLWPMKSSEINLLTSWLFFI